MKLLEYEAKQILKTFGISVPKSIIVNPQTIAITSFPIVLKSQVPVGGRGKAGGVVVVNSNDEFQIQKTNLFKLSIKNFLPRVLLAEELIHRSREHYLAFLVDRASSSIRLIVHKNGGIEVEGNANQSFFNREVTRESIKSVAKDSSHFLGYSNNQLEALIGKLFRAFSKSDATLIEVNPLIFTQEGEFICGDCKMELDDAANFRHAEWNFEDKPKDTNFVVLNSNGNIATIANGAGLAMATVDAVAAQNMTPANFLDIGGGATVESVLAAFAKIQTFSSIRAIVINIFAGITRCDQIAKAIIEAKKHSPNLPPIFIRLAGTNFEEAVALLAAEGIPTLGTLEDCLMAAKEMIHG
jgi:succinyl-CoA synthetase beta subunit